MGYGKQYYINTMQMQTSMEGISRYKIIVGTSIVHDMLVFKYRVP